MSFIRFEKVKKEYKMGDFKIKALDGVSFEIEKGEVCVILGPSGAGKTTLLNLLGGMERATSGKIFVGDDEVTAYRSKRNTYYRREDIGFVFQFYNLIPNLTAVENVELSAHLSKDHIPAQEALEMVELSDRLKNFPSQLSGGEQQRVAIARAFAKKPKLLLCDEPTGALDYNTGKSILKLLRNISEKYGMTVVIITHNSALTAMADRIVKLRGGEVVSVEKNENPVDPDTIEW